MLPYSPLQRPSGNNGGGGTVTFDGSAAIGDLVKKTGVNTLGKVTNIPRSLNMVGGTIGNNVNFYTNSSTGNDTNPGTLAQPFRTIMGGLKAITLTPYSGVVYLNIANGTYTEDIQSMEVMCGAIALAGNSSVILNGNAAHPELVIIQGTGGTGISHLHSTTEYTIVGMTITGNGVGRGISLNSAYMVAFDVNITGVQIGINQVDGYFEYYPDVAGGNISASLYGMAMSSPSAFFLSTGTQVKITDVTIGGVLCNYGAFALFYNGVSIIGDVAGGMQFGGQSNENSLLQIQGNTLIKHCTGYGFEIAARSIVEFYNASMTLVFDNVAMPINVEAQSYCVSQMSSGAGGGASYINGTPSSIQTDPSSVVQGTFDNVFSGAKLIYFSTNYGIRLGTDYRYADTVKGQQGGALPQGVTQFFSFSGLQANYVPLHQAVDNEIVYSLQVVGLGNGGGHTDTYSIYKNSAAGITTMSIAVTNGTGNYTITNPVALAPGETIGIGVTTDAGTTGSAILATARVIKK